MSLVMTDASRLQAVRSVLQDFTESFQDKQTGEWSIPSEDEAIELVEFLRSVVD